MKTVYNDDDGKYAEKYSGIRVYVYVPIHWRTQCTNACISQKQREIMPFLKSTVYWQIGLLISRSLNLTAARRTQIGLTRHVSKYWVILFPVLQS